jgi:hypothetical protein
MDCSNKPEKVPVGSCAEESIDLSAGFIPKNTPAAGEPASAELTPDAFMAQQPKPASVPDSFDSFMAQQFSNRPNLMCETRFHSGRNSQRGPSSCSRQWAKIAAV